ncbi:hypothetical protein EGW08_003609 [Elysia chlorotica]|uniref:DALR anticodon binding domain-containing protein n=1 Tax=Elysia chlorotica TaxID=188477 RepID=A0A3S1BHV5_ELYCH|nr:hypothetical protein EGW08_003609 [Elysia chlorotica]
MESAFQLLQNDLEASIREALTKTQEKTHNLSVNLNVILRKKVKDLHQGDLIVPSGCLPLDSIQQEKLLLLMKEYCSLADTLTSRVTCDKYNLLTFFIDRPRMFGSIIKEVLAKGPDYGCSKIQHDKSISLHSVSSKKTSMMDLRLAVVKCHAIKLLKANGFNVLPETQQESSEFEQLVQSFSEDVKDVSSEDGTGQDSSVLDDRNAKSHTTSVSRQHILPRLHSLASDLLSDSAKCGIETACVVESSPKSIDVEAARSLKDFVIEEGKGNLFIDMQRVISSRHLHQGKGGFDMNLKTVPVIQEGQPSPLLEESLSLLDSVSDFPQAQKHHCLHIVPHSAAFTNQKVILITHSLVDNGLSQSQLVVGPIKVQDTSPDSSPSAQEFYNSRLTQFKEASEMRSAISNNVCNKDDIVTLTDASIKIDILGNACGNPLTLENTASDRGAESRLGAFILYNTARLSTLLQKFDQAVEGGFYPALPPVDQIDWALLREEEDWELVYVYLAFLPELVSQSVEAVLPVDGKLSAKIHTHKVTNFLVSFCKCLSAHYSRYHILTGRESHLLPLMYARLYMMKAAHQVLLNSLRLLEVKALDYV